MSRPTLLKRLIRFNQARLKKKFHTGSYRPTPSVPSQTGFDSLAYLWRLLISPSHLVFLSGNAIMAIHLICASRKYNSIASQSHEEDLQYEDGEDSDFNPDHFSSLNLGHDGINSILDMNQEFGQSVYHDVSVEKVISAITTQFIECALIENSIRDLLNGDKTTMKESMEKSIFADTSRLFLEDLIGALMPYFNNTEINRFDHFFSNLDESVKLRLLGLIRSNPHFIDLDKYVTIQNGESRIENVKNLNLYYNKQKSDETELNAKLDELFDNYKKTKNETSHIPLVMKVCETLLNTELKPSVGNINHLLSKLRFHKLKTYEKIVFNTLFQSKRTKCEGLYQNLVKSSISSDQKQKFMKLVSLLELNTISLNDSDNYNVIFKLYPKSSMRYDNNAYMISPKKHQSRFFSNVDDTCFDRPYIRDIDPSYISKIRWTDASVIPALLDGCIAFKQFSLADSILKKFLHNSVKTNGGRHMIVVNDSNIPKDLKLLNNLRQDEISDLLSQKVLTRLIQLTVDDKNEARLRWLLPQISRHIYDNKKQFGISGDTLEEKKLSKCNKTFKFKLQILLREFKLYDKLDEFKTVFKAVAKKNTREPTESPFNEIKVRERPVSNISKTNGIVVLDRPRFASSVLDTLASRNFLERRTRYFN